MTGITEIIIRVIISVIFAIILGNGEVVLFNHLPAEWFRDEGRLPERLVRADNEGRQRIPSTPWKYLFVGFFGISGVFLAVREGTQYEIAAIVVLAIVLMMAIADQLYCIVPDQLNILLAISCLGFINFYDSWWEPLAGAGVGLLLSLSIWGLGMLLYRTEAIGGADAKFYVCMGLVAGRSGILIIFVLTTLCTAVQTAFLIATRRGTIRDHRAMMPCALVACWIYFMFMWSIFDVLTF